mmetsp:Transcript_103896/g.260573  ORF Transcript_103896/g.260573 Transcript_103896/m.260573 type:complete len:209 (+) Transcript_103896:378-1004(+)
MVRTPPAGLGLGGSTNDLRLLRVRRKTQLVRGKLSTCNPNAVHRHHPAVPHLGAFPRALLYWQLVLYWMRGYDRRHFDRFGRILAVCLWLSGRAWCGGVYSFSFSLALGLKVGGRLVLHYLRWRYGRGQDVWIFLGLNLDVGLTVDISVSSILLGDRRRPHSSPLHAFLALRGLRWRALRHFPPSPSPPAKIRLQRCWCNRGFICFRC